jgi:serine/threonine-protein kinase
MEVQALARSDGPGTARVVSLATMSDLIGKTFGHYHILDVIGQGGMSSVYRALDLVGNRVVALKVISPHIASDERFKGRFEREVQLLSDLQHPNIVPILAFGEIDGYHYIVMPFMQTGTLHERLRAGPLTPVDGARLIEQISSALNYAHQQGIVHRDIKPSNILLDEQGNALLSDFGFAHLANTSVRLTGSLLIGTPMYMSPEQCRGDAFDARSDQYSLGVILFQLATGRLPFSADTPMGVVLKQANEPLPQPRKVNPNLPEAVEAVIVKALAKDPAQRFASVAEMNVAFQSALKESLDPSGNFRRRPAGDPLKTKILDMPPVRQPEPPPRSGRRRTWAVVAGLLAVVICGVAGLGLGFVPFSVFAGRSGEAAVSSGEPDFMATVHALSTSIATDQAPGAPPGRVETAAAGTLAAWRTAGTPTKLQGPVMPGEPSGTPASGEGPTSAPESQSGMQETQGSTSSPGPSLTAAPSQPSPTRMPSSTPTATASPTPLPPVTITPGPTATNTLVPSRTASSTLTATSTATVPGTSTSVPGPSATPTATPVPTATFTGVPTATPTAAPTTQPPPTATHVPTRTRWPTRTRTPTRTPSRSPTITPTPAATTPPPPTITQTSPPLPTATRTATPETVSPPPPTSTEAAPTVTSTP